MPRALRIEYPGAIYHVMNRDDRAKSATHPERRAGQAGLDDGRVGAATQRRSEKSAHCPTVRVETAVTLKWIAEQLHMGTWTHVANRLQQAKEKSEPNNQHELRLV